MGPLDIEKLDELPVGSVILDAGGEYWMRGTNHWYGHSGEKMWSAALIESVYGIREVLYTPAPDPDHEPSSDDKRMVIRLNTNLQMSRGKYAAQAVHAALRLLGNQHGFPVIVLGGKPSQIQACDVVIRDAGLTEVMPGSMTAGASWARPDAN